MKGGLKVSTSLASRRHHTLHDHAVSAPGLVSSAPMRSRLLPLAASLGLVGVVLSPLGWPRERDDYPLSTYPMFTTRREREVIVRHVLALDEAGVTKPLGPDLVGNGAVIHAAATVRRAIEGGAAEALCGLVAARLSASDPPEAARTHAILVATSTFDLETYFAGARAPLRREIHSRCAPPRPAGDIK